MSSCNIPKEKKLLFLMTGSIACFKACSLISALKKKGYDIKVAVTPSVYNFIGKATIEGLTGHPVIDETFLEGSMMDHIYLERWADKILMAPGSANTINKMATGVCDNLVTTLFMAHDFTKDFFIVPAMNTKMYEHPTTQANLNKLKEMGLQVLPTAKGDLACGETGGGRMLEVEDIISFIEPKPQTVLNILVTAGGTKEPIDGVRSITNTSSGKTGASLAKHFEDLGHNVNLLRAESSAYSLNFKDLLFTSAADLDNQLQKSLSSKAYDVVVHLAAVSDYTVDKLIIDGVEHKPSTSLKVSSGSDLSLKLTPTKKIISSLKSYSKNKDIKVIGFKLTNTKSEDERTAAVEKLFKVSKPDLVVQNDKNQIDDLNHIFLVYRGGDSAPKKVKKIEKLVKEILGGLYGVMS